MGDPFSMDRAATSKDGTPFDAERVEKFLRRYGSDEAIVQWRLDINDPIPLA